MAIRIRDRRAYMRLDVLAHRTVVENGKQIHEVVCGSQSGDVDQIIIRSPWARLPVEFPVGTDVAFEMDRARRRGAGGPTVE